MSWSVFVSVCNYLTILPENFCVNYKGEPIEYSYREIGWSYVTYGIVLSVKNYHKGFIYLMYPSRWFSTFVIIRGISNESQYTNLLHMKYKDT